MAKHERGLRFQPAGGTRANQIPTGKKQRLTIERLANDGRGIAFFEGKTWFVAGSLAGEEVEARVLNAHGKIVEARTERVFQGSAMRRPAPCGCWFRKCATATPRWVSCTPCGGTFP
ncbi:TRAM domain-containing protein, partial [Pseudomonas syringae]|nr:TRAM domain-containing protein [Pseudomonas syringae]